MRKNDIQKLINEFHEMNSQYPLEEIIQSILDEDTFSNDTKINFIKLRLQMCKADKEIIKILEEELIKEELFELENQLDVPYKDRFYNKPDTLLCEEYKKRK